MTDTATRPRYELAPELTARALAASHRVARVHEEAAEEVRQVIAEHVRAHYPTADVLVCITDEDDDGDATMSLQQVRDAQGRVLVDLDDDEDLDAAIGGWLDALAEWGEGYTWTDAFREDFYEDANVVTVQLAPDA